MKCRPVFRREYATSRSRLAGEGCNSESSAAARPGRVFGPTAGVCPPHQAQTQSSEKDRLDTDISVRRHGGVPGMTTGSEADAVPAVVWYS